MAACMYGGDDGDTCRRDLPWVLGMVGWGPGASEMEVCSSRIWLQWAPGSAGRLTWARIKRRWQHCHCRPGASARDSWYSQSAIACGWSPAEPLVRCSAVLMNYQEVCVSGPPLDSQDVVGPQAQQHLDAFAVALCKEPLQVINHCWGQPSDETRRAVLWLVKRGVDCSVDMQPEPDRVATSVRDVEDGLLCKRGSTCSMPVLMQGRRIRLDTLNYIVGHRQPVRCATYYRTFRMLCNSDLLWPRCASSKGNRFRTPKLNPT